ncbi:hypothetical protein MBLNU230_g7253t1 [Neophaeotheca triangularis]
MANAAYTQFLKTPNPSLLSSSATINYITTNTSISEPTAIIKHLNAQEKQVVKLDQKTIHAIESQDGLSVCLELEVTLRFENGGGVYLPKMDDNLLDEKTVTLAMMHVAQLDPDGKISQIRIYWDQGSLLKMVEAIGKTGRNWPIQDGKAYTAAMTKSVKAAGQGDGTEATKTLPLRSAAQNVKDGHKRESVSATRDPHASLDLFQPREDSSQDRSYTGPKFTPRESAKPAAREYGELFAGEETEGSKIRSPSPSKQDGTFKGGAGKHYKGNRIFDENEAASPPPARKKTYGQKYDHFAFGDGEDAPSPASRPTSSRNGAPTTQIDFELFNTPPKLKQKPQKEHERHWGPGVDEDDPDSPPKRPIVHAPRKDADPHFAFTDSPQTQTDAPKQQHLHRKAGQGLYVDNINNNNDYEDYEDATPKKENLANITNTNHNNNSTRHNEELGAHYSLTDAQATPAAVKPNQSKYQNVYKTAGDGMGGRKGTGRTWGFGDDSEPEEEIVRPTARSRRAQAEAGAVRDW